MTSLLNSQEQQIMQEITKNNNLMRRKLNSENPTESKRSSRKVPIRVYVKDATEVNEMKKKLDQMEKMQNLYKNRISELEDQVTNPLSFISTGGIRPLKESGGSSGSSCGSDISIPVEPIINGTMRGTNYSRVSSKPDPDRTKLLALYEYIPQPEAKGRLAFKEGDVLLLVSMRSHSGWWTAELHGQTGKIPSNYVEQLDPTKAFKAKVIKNYDAQQAGDMSIQRGSHVTILKKQDNGWYLGEKGSVSGFFPSTHVQRITLPVA